MKESKYQEIEDYSFKQGYNKALEEVEKWINEVDTPDNNKLKVYLKTKLKKIKEK